MNHFLAEIAKEYGQAQKSIAPAALDLLKSHNWTGNIRELRNVVERLIILSGKQIIAEDVKNYI